MGLVVLNTINLVSLPFIGGRTASSSPDASKPSPAPTPVTRSEYSRADIFLNGSFGPALATFGQIDPQMATCTAEFTTTSSNAMTITQPPLKNVLPGAGHAATPPYSHTPRP